MNLLDPTTPREPSRARAIAENRRDWITDQMSVMSKDLLKNAVERNGMIGIPLSPRYTQDVVILPPYKEGEPYFPDTYYKFDLVQFLDERKD